MSRWGAVLGLSLVLGCRTPRVVVPPNSGLTRDEYIAACAHAPGAKMRIYGCPASVYLYARPLYLVDGHRLPYGNGWWAMRRRERALKEIIPDRVATIRSLLPSDSVTKVYGPDAARGVVVITTKPRPRGDDHRPPNEEL